MLLKDLIKENCHNLYIEWQEYPYLFDFIEESGKVFLIFADNPVSPSKSKKIEINEEDYYDWLDIVGDKIASNTESREETILFYNISNLYHFTSLKNLESILKHGILSKTEMEKNHMIPVINDPVRNDELLDYISVSVGFPNYKMLYSLYHRYPKERYILLEMNPEILLCHQNNIFSPSNAADSELQPFLKYETNEESFDYLFDGFERSKNIINLGYSTDPQAEILFQKRIEAEFIERICYPSWFPTELKDLIALLAEQYHVFYEEDDELFGPRVDYQEWKAKKKKL